MAAVHQAQHPQKLLHARCIRPPAVQQERKDDVLLHGQLLHQLEGLEDKSDILPPEHRPLALFHRKQVPPIQVDVPGGRLLQTANTVQQRALSRAGFPDDCRELALLHCEGDVLQRVHLGFTSAVYLTEALHSQYFHFWVTSFIRPKFDRLQDTTRTLRPGERQLTVLSGRIG